MAIVKLNTRNQIVIPKEAREALGLRPGDELLVVPKGDHVVILARAPGSAERLAGSGRGVFGQPDRYLSRERTSWNRRRARNR